VRKAVTVGAVVAAVVGVAAAARPAWGLFSGGAVSTQAVAAGALSVPVPPAAGPAVVDGALNVSVLAGSSSSPDVVAAGSMSGGGPVVELVSPQGVVWTTPVPATQTAAVVDPPDGVIVAAKRDPTALTVLALSTGKVLRSVSLPATANWGSATFAVDPATGTVWVTLAGATPPYYSDATEMVPLDPTTGVLGSPIPLSPTISPVSAAWADGEVVVANDGGGLVFVDPTTGAVTNVSLPDDCVEPNSVAASPTGVVAAVVDCPGPSEDVDILSSPTAAVDAVQSPDLVNVAWDATAGEFAATNGSGTAFVTTTGQVTQLTWPYIASEGAEGAGLLIAPVAGGIAEDTGVGGISFVGLGEVAVGWGNDVVSYGPGPTEPPGATCEVLAGPSKSGPWTPVGGVPCYTDAYYPLATITPPAGDTWFAVQARFGDWRSGVSTPAQWAGA